MATFPLQIVTPDKLVFQGEAQSILVRTLQGDVRILAHHIDYSAPLSIGEAELVDAEGDSRFAACSGGLINVYKGAVRIAATTFEWADEIDVQRAREAQQRAEERLSKLTQGDEAYPVVEQKIRRALLRQRLAE